MQAEFKDIGGKTFRLGMVSLTWIDVRNIFDSFQEDNNYESGVIFKATGTTKIKRLADLIGQHLIDDTRPIREDIRSKLKSFCEFLYECEAIEMTLR